MCPFTVSSIGGGASIGGIGAEKYTWTHSPCLERNCRLWIFKFDESGEICAEGCSLQFLGLNQKEIEKNNKIKTEITNQNSYKYCNTCKHVSNKSGLFSDKYFCTISETEVSPVFVCEKYEP